MTFIPVSGVAQVSLCMLQASNQIQNVFHVYSDDEWDVTALQGVAYTFKDWWNTYYKNNTSNTVSLQKIIARSLESESALSIEYTTGLPISGLDTGEAMPGSVTVAVKWSTGYTGRSYRGRTFHCGLTVNMVNGNSLEGDDLTNLLAQYNALLSSLNGVNLSLVVVSRFHNNAPRTAGIHTEILACSIDTNIDSQRRRLNGRGV